MQETLIRTNIRWMIRRDVPDVVRVEQQIYDYAWTEEDFLRCLRQSNCIGMVATRDEEIVGYMVYELYRGEIVLLNFAVHPSRRCCGIGSQMIGKLIGKLSGNGRTRIRLEVREGNLPAQLFFRSHGFKAVQVLRGHFEDTGEDAYLMAYRIPEDQANEAGPLESQMAQPREYGR